MKSVLVTGGAGFIGGCFVRQMLENSDCRITNLDKLTYAGNLDSIESVIDHPQHKFVQGDIMDGDLVYNLLVENQIDTIINFAAESHVDRSIDGPAEFVMTNVVGTFRMLEAFRQYFGTLKSTEQANARFLHVSTDEVYGSLGPTGLFVESTAYSPNSPYSASKASSDHFVRAYHHTYHLPTLITNCSNNYGPFQFPEKLIPLMILNALEGKPLPIYGDGLNVRDWLYVEDHCRALRLVAEKGRPGEVYNIGGLNEKTNLHIVDTICALVDSLRPDLKHRPCQSLKTYVKDRPGHDRRYAIDCSKIQRELGWKPLMNFEQGLEQTVRWYLENPEWISGVTSGKYRRERLGLSC